MNQSGKKKTNPNRIKITSKSSSISNPTILHGIATDHSKELYDHYCNGYPVAHVSLPEYDNIDETSGVNGGVLSPVKMPLLLSTLPMSMRSLPFPSPPLMPPIPPPVSRCRLHGTRLLVLPSATIEGGTQGPIPSSSTNSLRFSSACSSFELIGFHLYVYKHA